MEKANDDKHIKPELIQSTIELNTDVCANISIVTTEALALKYYFRFGLVVN